MAEFLIPGAMGKASVRFFDRSPPDPALPLDRFSVQVTDEGLSASGQMQMGYVSDGPIELFAAMARQWAGWSDELRWESPEGELALRCSHDRRGQVSMRIKLRSGPTPEDWHVDATVAIEAGQLVGIARRATAFFGKSWVVEWRSPWRLIESPAEAATLLSEFQKELSPGHPLHDVPVEAIGRCSDADDVLFRLRDGSGRVAEVHLTWTRSPPDQPPWPTTTLYSSLEDWDAKSMSPLHKERMSLASRQREVDFVTKWLSSIRARITEGTLVSEPYFRSLNYDVALAAQTGEEFVAEWNRTCEEVRNRRFAPDRYGQPIDEKLSAQVSDVVQAAWDAVRRITDHEKLAAAVAKDFELILWGRLLGVKDPLLGCLWDVYDRGEFPIPPL